MPPASSSAAAQGPTITAPLYATPPARRGIAFNEVFRPSEGPSLESTYSLALSAENDVQRQLSVEQEVPTGVPLAEALVSRGLGRRSSLSSLDNQVTSSSSLLSPPHQEGEADIDSTNIYTPSPSHPGSSGPSRPVPKPRSATTMTPFTPRTAEQLGSPSQHHQQLSSSLTASTLNTLGGGERGAGRAEVMENGYMRPRKLVNYDHLPPPSTAPPQLGNVSSSKTLPAQSRQHHSALLRDNPATERSQHTYINMKELATELPPVVDRTTKPPDQSPPRIDRALKPKQQTTESSEGLLPPSFPTRTTSLSEGRMDSSPAQASISTGPHSQEEDEPLPPNCPTRTTSLANTLENSTMLREEEPFTEVDLPKPSLKTMKYTQISFDPATGKPVMNGPPPLASLATGDDVGGVKRGPVPAPRGITRVNYSDVDLAATNALANEYKIKRGDQMTLREAEQKSLKDKPYINVDRKGQVDEESDPEYYTHMRVSGKGSH